jgi:hypothetical protein
MPGMEFVFTGFRQDSDIRSYTFQIISADRTKSKVTVGADLSLIRKHRIPLQELPLLCRRLLETNGVGKSPTVMFTEKDMLVYVTERVAAEHVAELKRRAHRTPVSSRSGQAWRTAGKAGMLTNAAAAAKK